MQSDKPAPGVFVTALYCLVDMQERSLLLGSAGHPPLILLRDDHQTELMPHTGPALGLYAEAQYGEHSATLAEGDRVLLYTDGLFDAAGGTVAPTPETIADALGGISESHNILGQLLAQVSDGEDTGDRDDVSMILLEVGSGENQLDEPVDLHIHATGAEREEPNILYAETEHTTFLTLDGRVTWVCGQALLDSALSVLDADRDLVIDLAHCEYLDSTLLGTLHELAEVAKQAAATLRLQNVPQALIDAFAELSMSEVLDCITSEPAALPERQRRVQLPEHSRGAHQRRLLRAHEMLAELSDENRREFSGVIEALRNEPD